MGDIIHSMLALQYIKQALPTIHIDWIVEKRFVPILEYNPNINTIYPIELQNIKKKPWSLFKQLKTILSIKNNNYDTVIDVQGLFKSALVTRLIGKKTIGFCKNSIRETYASWFYDQTVSIDYGHNIIERNVELFNQALNLNITSHHILNKSPLLFFTPAHRINTYLSKNDYTVLIVVGSSWKSKQYCHKKLITVINELPYNVLLLWGDNEEKERAMLLHQQTQATLLPKLSLNELKHLISTVDLVIGGDTGPTHMAWALNKPSITLFGNTPAYRNSYTTSMNQTLQASGEVNPYNIDKHSLAINTIDEYDIIQLAHSLLNNDSHE